MTRNQAYYETEASAKDVLRRYGVFNEIKKAINEVWDVAIIDTKELDFETIEMIKRAAIRLGYTVTESGLGALKLDFSTVK